MSAFILGFGTYFLGRYHERKDWELMLKYVKNNPIEADAIIRKKYGRTSDD